MDAVDGARLLSGKDLVANICFEMSWGGDQRSAVKLSAFSRQPGVEGGAELGERNGCHVFHCAPEGQNRVQIWGRGK